MQIAEVPRTLPQEVRTPVRPKTEPVRVGTIIRGVFDRFPRLRKDAMQKSDEKPVIAETVFEQKPAEKTLGRKKWTEQEVMAKLETTKQDSRGRWRDGFGRFISANSSVKQRVEAFFEKLDERKTDKNGNTRNGLGWRVSNDTITNISKKSRRLITSGNVTRVAAALTLPLGGLGGEFSPAQASLAPAPIIRSAESAGVPTPPQLVFDAKHFRLKREREFVPVPQEKAKQMVDAVALQWERGVTLEDGQTISDVLVSQLSAVGTAQHENFTNKFLAILQKEQDADSDETYDLRTLTNVSSVTAEIDDEDKLELISALTKRNSSPTSTPTSYQPQSAWTDRLNTLLDWRRKSQ